MKNYLLAMDSKKGHMYTYPPYDPILLCDHFPVTTPVVLIEQWNTTTRLGGATKKNPFIIGQP
eukprot:scaffold117077_cov65-Attheya_sp.AAC.7